MRNFKHHWKRIVSSPYFPFLWGSCPTIVLIVYAYFILETRTIPTDFVPAILCFSFAWYMSLFSIRTD